MTCTNPLCECKPGTYANLNPPRDRIGRENLEAPGRPLPPAPDFSGVIDQDALDRLSDDDVDALWEILRKVK